MVFSALAAIRVAHASASVWRRSACVGGGILEGEDGNPLTTTQLLDLICCFPLQQLGRLVLFVWTFLCVPPRDYYYYLYSYSSDDEEEEEDGVDFGLLDDGASTSRFGYNDYEGLLCYGMLRSIAALKRVSIAMMTKGTAPLRCENPQLMCENKQCYAQNGPFL